VAVTSARPPRPPGRQLLVINDAAAVVAPQYQFGNSHRMDQRSRDATPVTHRPPGAVSLSWALGALASLLLALWHLPFGVIAALALGNPWWAFALPAILLAQAGLCLACAAGWFSGRGVLLGASIAVLTVAQAAVATVAWWDYSPHQWILWIGPVPMLIAALIDFAAAAIRRPHSP